MGSDSLFKECKTCGKLVSKSAKLCSECGSKTKKVGIIHWVGIAFSGFVVISMIGNSGDNDSSNQADINESNTQKKEQPPKLLMPEDQARFIQIVTDYITKFGEVKNELQQSAAKDQRKVALSSSLSGYSIKSWTGTINQLETNTEGKAVLSVRVSPKIEIKTWNNALSDIASNTLIDKGTPVFNSLFDLTAGQRVSFSGSFHPSDSDFIKETSMTIDGSMLNPEFLFKFKTVTPIK